MKTPNSNTRLLTFTIAALTGFFTASVMAEGDGSPDRKRGKGRMAKQLRQQFDKDGDGKLSEAERATAKAAMKERKAAADTDGDGKVSKGERLAAFKERLKNDEAFAAKVRERFDKDKDGELSDEELKAAAAKAGPRRGPGARSADGEDKQKKRAKRAGKRRQKSGR